MIYFIRFNNGLLKIGQSGDPKTRLRDLKRGKWYGQHRVLKLIEGDWQDETDIHRLFNHLRLYKDVELFAPGRDLMEFIGRPGHAIQDVDSVIRNHWFLAVRAEFKRHKDRGWLISREQIRKAVSLALPDRNFPEIQPPVKSPHFDSLFGCAWPAPIKQPRRKPIPPPPDAEFYSVQAAAIYLGVNRTWLAGALAAMSIPLTPIGQSKAVKRSDLERLRPLVPRKRAGAPST